MKNTMTAALPSIIKAGAMGVALSVSAFASAAPATYATPGTENTMEYSFTAATDGDIVAYFVSKGEADYTNTLRVYVNGVDTGFSGLTNQTSSYGDSVNFGFASAGASITFVIDVADINNTWSSSQGQNSDGGNHVFASTYAGDEFIPTGVYVAFEDLDRRGYTDFDYIDQQIVFTNVSLSAPEVPVPASAWLLGSGLLGLAGVARRRTKA